MAKYNAIVKINKVEKFERSTGTYNTPKEHIREVTDLADIVISADSLEKLTTKVQAHIALVEE